MIELNVTFFIQLVNFLIVLLLLNIILYKPIRGMLNKRAEIMSDKVSEVEKFSASAQDKMKAYESELDKARARAQEIRTDLKGEGYAKESEIVDSASGEAMSMVKAAREKISKEKDAAVSSLRKEVEKFAEKATEKILTKA
jgi:F-type H+-transporting ATPase subunit b